MRIFLLSVCSLLLTTLAFGQGAAGTITGTVTDPSGAVIANAMITVRNTANGQVYSSTSTETGNYTATQLPVGTYELTVTVTGFKAHNRAGLELAAAQIMRIDVPLEIGATGEAVTVTGEASLLKTESGDLTHNVTVGQLNTLPVLTIGGGGGTNTNGFRDPLGVALIIPGTQYAANSRMVVNGDPSGTIQQRIEGQTSGQTGSLASFTGMGQASVESIQEVAVQTSNYMAEYGAVGGAIFNVTMKSGTNQYHGSAYDYAVNEALNAHQPYTGLRSPTKRHDYGGTIGGPIRIPKLYNGTNKSFFFFGFEQFREDIRITTSVVTVPIDPYRIGNFQQVITGSGNLPIQVGGKNYIDPTGRTGILSGTLFDPTTQRSVTCNTTTVPGANCSNGSVIQVRDPFPSNQVPAKYFDAVSLKILKLVPEPTGPNFLNGQVGGNYQNPWLSSRRSEIPSIKLDHSFSQAHHTSFYYQETATGVQYTTPNGVAEGLPEPITAAIGSYAHTYTYRLNHDWSIRPTLLLHVGAGWFHNNFDTHAGTTNYNANTELGLHGATVNRTFPNINTGGSAGNGIGGMNNLGPVNQSTAGSERRPSGVSSLTWVKGNHTYKLGGEWRGERYPARSFTGTAGSYTFASNSTQQTALQSITTSQGSTGFAFASFLMGDVTAYSLSLPTAVSTGKQQWGLYLQDSWKIARNLTFDYGVRWDYGGYARERWGRNSNFSETVPNPSADGHPGGQIFEATCKCNFAANYPYAIGPRLGVAYKINNKTVFRSGFGIVYTATGFVGGNASNTASGGTPGFGQWLGQLQDGMPASVQPQWPVYTPNVGQAPGSVVLGPAFLDPNAGRPARQYQWSASLQREITRNLVVEASYVGNRGVWWPAGALGAFNVTSAADLTRYGFQLGNLNDATLLSRQLSALTPAQKTTLTGLGINLPYASYPTSQTVRQSLLPFPQYSGSTFAPTLAPLGKTWYDAAQITVTKRYSHGLTLNANYTYSKNLDLMNSPDIFNRSLGKDLSANDLPHQFRLTTEYVTPRTRDRGLGVLSNKVVSYVVSDWGLGWYMQYQSATILARPATNTTNPISLWLGRGPGSAQLIPGMSPWAVNWTDYSGKVHPEPLDINCRCYDPTKTIVLNPLAWTNVPDGQWAAQTSSIRDYRGYRAPTENANLNRNFRIGKEGRVQLNIRGEFQNIFNRTRLPNPTATGFQSAPTKQTSGTYVGLYNGGFGSVVPIAGTAGSRTGTLIARLTF